MVLNRFAGNDRIISTVNRKYPATITLFGAECQKQPVSLPPDSASPAAYRSKDIPVPRRMAAMGHIFIA
jgi:hypothetical protein